MCSCVTRLLTLSLGYLSGCREGCVFVVKQMLIFDQVLTALQWFTTITPLEFRIKVLLEVVRHTGHPCGEGVVYWTDFAK